MKTVYVFKKPKQKKKNRSTWKSVIWHNITISELKGIYSTECRHFLLHAPFSGPLFILIVTKNLFQSFNQSQFRWKIFKEHECKYSTRALCDFSPHTFKHTGLLNQDILNGWQLDTQSFRCWTFIILGFHFG